MMLCLIHRMVPSTGVHAVHNRKDYLYTVFCSVYNIVTSRPTGHNFVTQALPGIYVLQCSLILFSLGFREAENPELAAWFAVEAKILRISRAGCTAASAVHN